MTQRFQINLAIRISTQIILTMKTYATILSCLLLVSSISTAQNAATPNAGFENWTQNLNYWNPNNWNNLNSQTAILGVFTCTRATGADVHSGTYAIKLTTKSVFTLTANGIASTATLITSPPYGVTGGIPYTERPDSIVGWYKYTPANPSDSGFVQFVLLGASNDTIGFVKFNSPNTPVTSYTRFSKAITYFSPNTPALSYWILSSSDGVNPVVNSSIIIDDLDLIFNPSSVNETKEEDKIHLVSNLIHDYLQVNNQSEKEMELNVIDNSGRVVSTFLASTGISQFNIQHLRSGIYFYRFSTPASHNFSYGKLVKW